MAKRKPGTPALTTFIGLRKIGWDFKKALRMTFGDDQGKAVRREPRRKR